MTLYVDESTSPPICTGTPTGEVATTDEFTPPVGSVLVALVAANSSVAGATTATVTDSEGLVWTARVTTNINNVAGIEGYFGIFTAVPARIPRPMTVTVTTAGSTATTRRPTMKVFVVAGADTSNPQVGSARATSGNTTNNLTVNATQSVANSLLIAGGSDWNRLGVPTSSNLTGEGFSNDTAGVSGFFGWRLLDATPGTEPYNLDAFGAAAAEWQACRIEIRPAPVTAGLPIPGLDDALVNVEAAFGADYSGDPNAWAWTDVTADVRLNPGIGATLGRGDEASTSQPALCTFTLDNTSGNYSSGGQSAYYPYIRRGTPIRVQADPGDGTRRTVFTGYADGFTPDWDSLRGDIPVVRVEASGVLRRLQQGAPAVISPARRYLGGLPSVVAYWPMEEGEDATYSPAAFGGTPLRPAAEVPDFGRDTTHPASRPLPVFNNGAMTANTYQYTDTGEHQLRLLFTCPADGLADGTVIGHFATYGSLVRWDLTYEIVSGIPGIALFIYKRGSYAGADDGVFFDNNISNWDSVFPGGIDGRAMRISLELTQVGANVEWDLRLMEVGGRTGVVSGTAVNHNVTRFAQMTLGPSTTDPSGVVLGHITIQDEITSPFEGADFLSGFDGEYPTVIDGRLERLCEENGLALEVTASGETVSTFDAMGPQRIAPLVDLLRDCETTDRGQLWDGRHAGISYTTRRVREDGDVMMVLDAAAGDLAPPFAPVDDDQRTRNRAEVERIGGIVQVFEDVDGPMGTATIGTYDTSDSVSLARDEATVQHAAWLVHLGTVYGYRYPSVTVDLAASPDQAVWALQLVPGHRVQITNPNDVLDGYLDARIELLVEGITHEISSAGWRATLRCSPAYPWLIAKVAADTGDTGEFMARQDTAGSRLVSAAAVGATALSVSTTSGPLWTTAADDYPLTLDVGGVPVVASACSGASSPQTFTVAPLEYARVAGVDVKLWTPRPLGL